MGPATVYPPFDGTKPRYNLDTFWGRVSHYLSVIDPRTLLNGQEQVDAAQRLLAEWRKSPAEVQAHGVTDGDLWGARHVLESCLHPTTQTIIPAPFRISGFIPVNIPIIFAMLTTTSPHQMLFWHWANQSYNTAVNYYNRSGAEVSTKDIATSYALAVTTSCSLAAGLAKAAERGSLVRLPPAVMSYVAVAAAGCSNIAFTRKNELSDGVPVSDADGHAYGNSVAAARTMVLQTAATRGAFLPLPLLLLPPAIMSGLGRVGMLPSNPRLKLGVEVIVITLCLGGAVPMALAMFPQTAQLNPKDLEPQFHDLRDSKGRRVEVLFANKGL